MATLQSERAIEVTTPLGEDVLLFHRMTASESLGRLFQFNLDLLSNDPNIDFNRLLGQNVTVKLELPEDETRYFNGFVSRFSQEGSVDDFNAYSMTLHPWLWFLTRTADCRIFQEMTVPDIIKQVFRDHGFTDFEEALSGTYRSWTYCVQYRETDFNFVSRLMEQEGIYYYFRHESNRHMLVLADSVSSHDPFPGYEKIPYFPPDEHLRREEHHIHEWTISQEVQPGVYALTDYDFENPKANLQVKSSIARGHAQAKMEIFDYPGEYTQTNDGDAYVRARIEEIHSEFEQVQGQANARGLAVGSLFELVDYPREDQNQEYLVVSATYELESDAYGSGSSESAEDVYACSFTALSSKQQYRPERTTPKPLVQGPQTAMVVGPSGEEIHTDQYSRVKIQFHWDRYGKKDQNSSCWVRVAQLWAGTQWGGIHIPRIGQEVIVEFLEGDPDHPIITGRVYNKDNMPPYGLPANATQSGIKSRSSKGGGAENFNELRFEDKKGEEDVYLHAEKNWTINVENDKNQTVGHDETLSVGNNRDKTIGVDQSESIGANKAITVGGNHTENITGNMFQTVSAAKTETIALAKALTIGAGYQVSVIAAMNQTIGGLKAEQIGAAKSVNVGANSSENIGANKSVDAGSNISEKAGKDVSVTSGKKMALSAGDDLTVTGNKKGVISIKDQLTITVGKASITMKKNGDILIQGKDITTKSSGNVTTQANSGDIVMKAKKILGN
jgi:type VI secretion system secreted protein VgrG